MSINRSGILAFWAVFFLLVIYQLMDRTLVRSDMSAFLPAGADQAQINLISGLQEGTAARLWLISLSGETPAVLAAVSKDFAKRLRESDGFLRVLNGERVLDSESQKLLFEYRYLLTGETHGQRFSSAALHGSLTRRIEELGSPLSSFQKAMLPSDPSAAFMEVVENLAGFTAGPKLHNGVWFSNDQRQALLLAESRAPGMDLDAQQKLADLIKHAMNKAQEGAAIDVVLSGGPVFALETRHLIRSESQQLSILASLFMLIFMGVIYRSPQLVLMTALPLAGGVATAVATVSLLFGSIHGITLAFGITLMGVAVDYPVHTLSHIRGGESMMESVKRVWPTLRVGVLTTLLGYLAMSLTDFTGLAQLGIFSISGLLVAALMTRSLLPAIVGNAMVPAPRGMGVAQKLNRFTRSGWRWVLLLLTLAVVAISFRGGDVWSGDIAEISPLSTEMRTRDRQLRSALGAPESRYLLWLEVKSLEDLLQLEERLLPVVNQAVASGYLESAELAARILPSRLTQKLRQLALPDSATLQQSMDVALLDLPFRRDSFKPFIEAVEYSRKLPLLDMEALQAGPLGLRLESLVQTRPDGVLGLVPLSGVQQPALLKQLFDQQEMPGLQFVDLKQATSEMVIEFRQEALNRITIALGLIVGLLLILLRDPGRTLRVLFPIAVAVMVAATVPLLAGDRLNLFHLVSLLLVAGIGLDYALFFSRPSESSEHFRTSHALMVCSTSTLVVFAMLAASSIPVLHSIGLTVASGVMAAFVFSWLFARS
ncbi:MAG: MMPL family transporter [Gammaproteobacteria bacterium]|nr:MMPL family transporter [Gammaproteobacteria bacterium]